MRKTLWAALVALAAIQAAPAVAHRGGFANADVIIHIQPY